MIELKRFVGLVGETEKLEVLGEMRREKKGLGVVGMDILGVEWVDILLRGLICFGRGFDRCDSRSARR
jgi:hypothetical protein